jgi:quinol monooxygenase YgiN
LPDQRLTAFGRFHAHEGEQATVPAALREMLAPSRAETGCIALDAFASTRDPLLFYIHPRWIDEAAFDLHATLPHMQRMTPPIDHPFEVTRARLMG